MEAWYKNAIIYELDVKVFYDSNGDGIGKQEQFLEAFAEKVIPKLAVS